MNIHLTIRTLLAILLMGVACWAGDALEIQSDGTSKARNLVIDRATQAAGPEAVRGDDQRLLPVGVVLPFAGATPPAGYALCDGKLVSRTAFPALFAAIGTTYGAGDGATTFQLPDLRSRFLLGSGQGEGLSERPLAGKGGEESHTLTAAEIPPHTHYALSMQNRVAEAWSLSLAPDSWAASMSGAGIVSWHEKYNVDDATIPPKSGRTSAGDNTTDGPGQKTMPDGSVSPPGPGGKPHNTMPPFVTLHYIIKL